MCDAHRSKASAWKMRDKLHLISIQEGRGQDGCQPYGLVWLSHITAESTPKYVSGSIWGEKQAIHNQNLDLYLISTVRWNSLIWNTLACTSKHDTKWQHDHQRYSYFHVSCTLKYVSEKARSKQNLDSYLLNRLILWFSEQCVLRCLVPCHFQAQRPRCVNSKCTCTHLCAPGSVGHEARCGHVHWWQIVILRKQKNGRKSKAQSVSCYLKDTLDVPTQAGSHCSYTLMLQFERLLLVILNISIKAVMYCKKYRGTLNGQN